jgi:hypothetical protein
MEDISPHKHSLYLRVFEAVPGDGLAGLCRGHKKAVIPLEDHGLWLRFGQKANRDPPG